LGENTIELAHALREVGVPGFNEQVIVIGHQAVGMTPPQELLNDSGKDIEEGATVLVVFVNRFAPVASRGQVMEGT